MYCTYLAVCDISRDSVKRQRPCQELVSEAVSDPLIISLATAHNPLSGQPGGPRVARSVHNQPINLERDKRELPVGVSPPGIPAPTFLL
jgi:hypothetical protein